MPTATFTFSDRTLRPSVAVVDAGPSVRLVVRSDDGLAHGVVIATPAGRVRLVIRPGQDGEALLHGLHAGKRYRVVPDGATEPVTLQVR